MKTTVYVNFETGEVVGEKVYGRMVAELLDEIMKPEEFNKYLKHYRGFSYSEVFYMASERKPKILIDFEAYCRETVKNKLGFIEKEVEV